jgi:hypothetical protein
MPLNKKGKKIMKSMKKQYGKKKGEKIVQGQGKVLPEKNRKSKAY